MSARKIFAARASSGMHAYMTQVLHSRREDFCKFVMPECGQFSMGFGALEAGWTPGDCYASGVNLPSAILAHVINEQSLDALDIHIDGQPVGDMPPEEVLYRITLCARQQWAQEYWQDVYVKDLMGRREAHIAAIAESLKPFRALKGIHFERLDFWQAVERDINNPQAIIWLDPPPSKRDHRRRFDTGGRVTSALEQEEAISRSSYDRLRDLALSGRACVCWTRRA